MWCSAIGGIVTLILSLLAVPLAAEAPSAGKIPRLGVLVLGLSDRGLELFRQGLQDLGYVEGKTITIAYRFAEGKAERLPALAAELVGLKVDLIVAYAFQATRAAQQATQTLPIVMVDVGRDPVEAGLVENLARPGGNVTGLVDLGMQLHGKRLELLQEVMPRGARAADCLQRPLLRRSRCAPCKRRGSMWQHLRVDRDPLRPWSEAS
jgi:putative ABC transport system substrate-binding protein